MGVYNFYMQEVRWDNEKKSYVGYGKVYDLERDFKGLKYSKCDGLNALGEHRVYTEEFADENRSLVYMSEEPIYKATEIKLTLFFVGEDRQKTFHEFNNFISNGFHSYWDTARNRKFVFYSQKAIAPSNDKYSGSNPYIEVTYTLNNVLGTTESV